MTADRSERPSLIDAGHRVQPNSQFAGIRHFRSSTASVKHAGNSDQLTPAGTVGEREASFARNNRFYLRALRAAEMKAWAASGGDVLRTAFTT